MTISLTFLRKILRTGFLVLLSIVTLLSVEAQEASDSLSLFENIDSDTGRIRVLINLCDQVRDQPDRAKNLARESLTLATMIKDTAGEIQARFRLTDIFMDLGEMDSATTQVNDLLDKADQYQLGYARAKGHNFKGILSTMTSELDRALYHFKKAAEINLEIGDSLEYAGSLNNLGIIYNQLNQPIKELETLMEVLAIEEVIGSDYGLARTYTNLGQCYLAAGDTTNSKKYLEKSLEIATQNNYLQLQAGAHGSMGDWYNETGRPKQAIEAYIKGLAISRKAGFIYLSAIFTNSLGTTYKELEDFQMARAYLDSSLVFQRELGDYDHWLYVLFNLSELYLTTNEHDKALTYLEEAEELMLEFSPLHHRQRYQELQYLYHRSTGNTEQALQAYENFISLRDSLDQVRQSEELLELETQLETERKERENELLKKEKNLQDATIRSQRATNFAIAIGLALMGIIAVLIWISRQRQLRLNHSLNEKKIEVEKRNEEKELLLKEIHHRVKNNLQIISSLLELQSFDMTDTQAIEAISQGQQRVKAMALIHQKLYQNEDLSVIHFQDYLELLTDQIASAYRLHQPVEKKIEASDISLDIDTAIPLGLIVNELLTNSFKYAFQDPENPKQPEVEVTLESAGEEGFVLRYRDNGPGLPEGLDPGKAKSLGLRLSRRLSQQLHGDMEKEEGLGCRLRIRFKDTGARKKEW